MKKKKTTTARRREHRRDEAKISATAYRYNAIQRLNEAPFIIQFIANWTRTPVKSTPCTPPATHHHQRRRRHLHYHHHHRHHLAIRTLLVSRHIC